CSRTWSPLFPPASVRLTAPDWSLSAAADKRFLSSISSNLGYAALDRINQTTAVSGSVMANLGEVLVKDSSLLVLVRDNLAIVEGYGDQRWANYQLQAWPFAHNYPAAIIGTDQPQRWAMRVKVYTIDDNDVVSIDRPCLYLSMRRNDQNLYHWLFEAIP